VALRDLQGINDLFLLLSVCFRDRLNLAEFLDSLNTKTKNCTVLFQKIADEINADAVGKLVNALNNILKENCIFMEVLIRHTIRVLELMAGANCGSGCGSATYISEVFTDKRSLAQINAIITKLKCGLDVRRSIIALIESLGPDAVAFLMFIINGISLTPA
jgi:hypothetical protein